MDKKTMLLDTMARHLAEISRYLGSFVANEYSPEQAEFAAVDFFIRRNYVNEVLLQWASDYWARYDGLTPADFLKDVTNNGTFEELLKSPCFYQAPYEAVIKDNQESAEVIIEALFDMCRNGSELRDETGAIPEKLPDACTFEDFCTAVLNMKPFWGEKYSYIVVTYHDWLHIKQTGDLFEAGQCCGFLQRVLEALGTNA